MSEKDRQKIVNYNHGKKAEHSDLYHYVYSFGGSVLVGIVDFIFIWPESRLLALLAAAAWFSLLAVFELRNFHKEWSVTVPVFLFVGALIANFLIPVQVPETTVTGTLQFADDPTPQTGCDPATGDDAEDQPYWSPFGGFIRFNIQRPKEPPPKGAILVALGSNGVIVTKSEKVPIVKIGECTLLSIQRIQNSLLIDANVYNLKGELHAHVNDNAFTGIEDADSQITQEGDLSTLVVREGRNERLWVRFANSNAVQVRGIFFCPHTSTNVIVIGNDAMRAIPDPRVNSPLSTVSANTCVTDKPIGYGPP
jgi:hypothetical protein